MSPLRPEEVTAVIADVLGSSPRPIALHEPDLTAAEAEAAAACVSGGWVSYGGSAVQEFESRLEELVGAPVAAVASGTAALQLALQVTGVRRGDEVLTPAFTFAASAAAIVHAGAVPHFVDIEPRRLGVDPERLRVYLQSTCDRRGGRTTNRRSGRPIAALQAVHVFGHPCDLDGLAAVARDFDLVLLEDAAEALGSRHNGAHAATFGVAGALSFNGNKIVTTGGGGAVVSSNADLVERARHLSATAKVPHPWAFRHDAVGYNFRMPALNAALGVAQLDRLPGFLRAKRTLARRYASAFAALRGVRVMTEPPGAESNWWLNAIFLPDDPGLLEATLTDNHRGGYLTRPAWTPLHMLEPYAPCPRDDLPETELAARTLLNLPSSSFLAACRS